MRRSVLATYRGAYRKAHVGISNDKEGEIPSRRKAKGSQAMPISLGLVGS